MSRHLIIAAAVAALSYLGPSQRLAAQVPEHRFSATLFGGGLTPVADIGGNGDLKTSPDLAASFTYDLDRMVAIRGTAGLSHRRTTGAQWGAFDHERLDLWQYSVDAVVSRYTERGIRQYVFGGGAAVTLDPRDSGSGATKPALRGGLGLEWQPGASPIAFAVEGNALAYRLDLHGISQTQVDFAWLAGLTLHW